MQPADGSIAADDRTDGMVIKMVESQLQVCRQIESLLISTPLESFEQRRELYEMLQVHIGMYRTYLQWLPAEVQAQYAPSPMFYRRDPGAARDEGAATPPERQACKAEDTMADARQPPAAHTAHALDRATRGHARAQTVVFTLGAMGAWFARRVVDDTSYFAYLCILGALCLLVLAAAAQWLSFDAMAYAWGGFIVSWPLIRDASVLLLQEQTEATTAQTVAQVNVAFYWTRLVFFLLGILHHMVPKTLQWRVRVAALCIVINLVSTSRMEYPHIGDTPSIVATSMNEIAPFIAGFASVLLACGNTHGRNGFLPAWPRLWARKTDDFVAPS